MKNEKVETKEGVEDFSACPLCGEPSENLQKSHIIPGFMKELYQTEGGKKGFLRTTNLGLTGLTQDLLKTRMCCKVCEQEMSIHEGHAKRFFKSVLQQNKVEYGEWMRPFLLALTVKFISVLPKCYHETIKREGSEIVEKRVTRHSIADDTILQGAVYSAWSAFRKHGQATKELSFYLFDIRGSKMLPQLGYHYICEQWGPEKQEVRGLIVFLGAVVVFVLARGKLANSYSAKLKLKGGSFSMPENHCSVFELQHVLLKSHINASAAFEKYNSK